VSAELWQVVQNILDQRASSNVRTASHRFPFSGLIKCGHCGCAVVAQIAKRQYIYYHCSGYRGKCPEPYVRQEVIEQHFVGLLRRIDCSDRDFDILKLVLEAEDRRARASGDCTSSARMRKRPDAPGTFTREGIDLLDMARGAHRSLPALSIEAKRQMLSLLISHSTWANGELQIIFNRPFALFEEVLPDLKRLQAVDCSNPHFTVLRNLFRIPPPGTRQLIARYNAMVDLTWEIAPANDVLP
jgi:site-specific DNA recombinase